MCGNPKLPYVQIPDNKDKTKRLPATVCLQAGRKPKLAQKMIGTISSGEDKLANIPSWHHLDVSVLRAYMPSSGERGASVWIYESGGRGLMFGGTLHPIWVQNNCKIATNIDILRVFVSHFTTERKVLLLCRSLHTVQTAAGDCKAPSKRKTTNAHLFHNIYIYIIKAKQKQKKKSHTFSQKKICPLHWFPKKNLPHTVMRNVLTQSCSPPVTYSGHKHNRNNGSQSKKKREIRQILHFG